MKTKILISSLTALALLSGCGHDFQTLTTSDSSSASKNAGAQADSVSNKILQDVSRGLQQGSATNTGPALTEAQIAALIQSATTALQNGGLSKSTDLKALLPAIIEKLTKGLADLQLTGANPQTAELVAAIGKLVLGSVTQMNGAALTADLVALISKSLFQNLPNAGVSNGNLSSVAGGLMNSLVAHLGQQGLSTTLLTSLLQSVTSGATVGIGNLNLGNLSSAQISDILHKIGLGSAQGLTGLAGISSSSALLQTLIGAVVNGAQQGLNQGVGKQSGLGVTASQLLASLISGQATGLSNSAVPATQQKPISIFLQLLLSRI